MGTSGHLNPGGRRERVQGVQRKVLGKEEDPWGGGTRAGMAPRRTMGRDWVLAHARNPFPGFIAAVGGAGRKRWGAAWRCPWEMWGAPRVLEPDPRQHRRALARVVTQNGSKRFKGGMSHPGGGDGCELGAQDPWLGLFGRLWGLPGTVGLWNELRDTKVPEFPQRSGALWWLRCAPRPLLKCRQGLPIAIHGDTQHLPGYLP